MAFAELSQQSMAGAPAAGSLTDAGLLEQAPVGILELDASGRLIRSNAAAAQLLGLDAARMVAARTQDLLQVSAAIADLRSGPITTSSPNTVVWRTVTRADDQVLRLELRLSVFSDLTASRPTVVVFLLDRTNEHRLAKQASYSQRGLDAIIQSAPLALAVLDTNNRIERWNTASETMFGLDESAAIGTTVAEAFGLDERDVAPLLDVAWAGGVVNNAPLAGVARDGEEVDIELSISPLYDESRSVSGLVCIGIDQTVQRSREQRVRASEHRLARILQNISETVTIIDKDGNTKGGSGATTDVLGQEPSFWNSGNLFDLVHPDDLATALELLKSLEANPGEQIEATLRMRNANGSYHHAQGSAVNLLDDPDINGILITTRNVTPQVREAAQREGQATIFKLVAAGASLDFTLDEICKFLERQSDKVRTAVLLLDEDGFYYPASSPNLQSKTLRWVGREPYLLDAAADHELGGVHQFRIRTVRTDAVLEPERIELERAGIRSIWTTPIESSVTGQRVGVVASFCETERDPDVHEQTMGSLAGSMAAIAVERKRSEEQLSHQALHDELTGLANRQLLLDRLEKSLSRARRRSSRVGLMFLDLDRFKMINDSLGHEAGDAVIVEFASRLRQLVRPEDTVARFGGDEFVILIEEVIDDDELNHIAGRLETSLAMPIEFADKEVFITCSMGLAVSDGQRESAATLFQQADAAMYLAKERGRDRLEVFDEEMRSLVVERLTLETDLRRAVERNQILVHHQPIVDLASGRVVSIEALARWNHHERGILTPESFIPIAEDTGMIVEIGAVVLEHALANIRALTAVPGLQQLGLSVNISARQLVSPELVPTVERLLRTYQWPGSRLTLEITESVLITDADSMLEILGELQRLGVAVAIDDFGTGYSSLAYLHRFKVNQVKIDRSFTTALTSGEQGMAIARAVIQMAHALGVQVVAEGVETSSQLQLLQDLGCDMGQGWLFSRALPTEALRGVLVERSSFLN